ncbi:MAG: DUF721 domain-containing protein [Flavobacteriaceae bacterium]|nr:DUF721 domain-containing protein [Flavobacteriaceae bacterium]
MAKRNSNTESFSSALEHLLAENPKLKTGMFGAKIKTAWPEVMGNAVHKYTQKLVFQHGKLFVYLDSSVLKQELTYGLEQIKTNLNEHLGEPAIEEVILK